MSIITNNTNTINHLSDSNNNIFSQVSINSSDFRTAALTISSAQYDVGFSLSYQGCRSCYQEPKQLLTLTGTTFD